MSEIIYGIHPIKSLLKCEPQRFLEVFLMKNCKDHKLICLIELLKKTGIIIQIVKHRHFLNKKTNSKVHQGIMAIVRKKRQYQEKDLLKLLEDLEQPPFLLILDGITDPHNLGACLRSADAAGVNIVIIPRDRSAQLNATVMKVSCGAAAYVPLISVTNLVRTIRVLQKQNIWIIGTEAKANSNLYQSSITSNMALAFVMGSEHCGMRHLTRKSCDELISIPMLGKNSSLNVSVATGICLFEVVRKRV
ncbi:23S rRNA (guanosine-2'-O-)-methyltransferase RlmB [Candidatus Profftia lariciata]|uniref:23S rRNA (guanosine(2251)-2'-O)-methyltransferase RlmB n=1 Tax=Candidatus Profftia lariciata TaxID=1987921 RepID=UPI001D0122EE|nr:23S rRNA (guanosine(2251)-2'-O)-methyltransferase RlmB [Candidatus Profftia lariciata]UDG81709.1 23S rRNA (guanosine-2'-O-)-methyltransferase RlmB [Candidatus Profftia lariciata]